MTPSSPTRDALAAVLETHRTHADLSYRQLMHATGISLTTITRRFADPTGLTVSEFYRLTTALDTTPCAVLAEAVTA